MRGFKEQSKFLSIKAQDGYGRALKNVLTEKRRPFFGDLAEKHGFRVKKMTACGRVFALLRGSLSRKRMILKYLQEWK
jgi:hypothetical protein